MLEVQVQTGNVPADHAEGFVYVKLLYVTD